MKKKKSRLAIGLPFHDVLILTRFKFMKKRIYQKFEAVIFVLRFGMIKMAWLTFLLLFHFEVTYATNVFPQEMRVSLDLKDASMQEFMQVVKEKTGVSFIFSAALILMSLPWIRLNLLYRNIRVILMKDMALMRVWSHFWLWRK